MDDQDCWVEKYRPTTLEGVIGQQCILRTLMNFYNRGSIPNLIFHGPPGTGKTSTMKALCSMLYGADKTMYLELNASDDRGISVIKDRIRGFAETDAPRQLRYRNGQAAPAGEEQVNPASLIKFVILDEADQMTAAAQLALRRVMEPTSEFTNKGHVRYCLICNVDRIVAPLKSRCLKFRYRPLKAELMIARLVEVGELEGVKVEREALKHIVNCAKGDMRHAINLFQSVASVAQKEPEGLTLKLITELLSLPDSADVAPLIELSFSLPLKELIGVLTRLLRDRRFTIEDIVQRYYEDLLSIDAVTPLLCQLVSRLGEIERCAAMGADEYLQAAAFASAIYEFRMKMVLHGQLRARKRSETRNIEERRERAQTGGTKGGDEEADSDASSASWASALLDHVEFEDRPVHVIGHGERNPLDAFSVEQLEDAEMLEC